ncbi:MAG: substrate-binding domain-containing protein [Chloroflexi bacterium]|nr:substrate-binding domain-containing protein [Chloroflexota bacterium]
MRRIALVFWVMMLALLLAACQGDDGSTTSSGGIPANAIQISIVYAPESELYLPRAIEDFNRAYAEGRNPLTGQPLAAGERPIYITGEDGSSGTVMQGIVNAFIAPNNQNVSRPTIFAPSVSHWLALANYQSGRQIFDLAAAQPTALAPVVIAIWESRLQAIRETVGYDEIGWAELLAVLQSPNGWADYGIADGRRAVYYGHTDPLISSTGLSTLIAEFYAAARAEGFAGRRLTLEQVNDTAVQQGVRNIEELIRHYSRRTTEFKEYIAQGPEYLDFVALEENDLIYINQGLTQYQPPERLVALYPREGTFWHEHPFGIVQVDVAQGGWTTAEQREAARVFTEYVLTPAVQEVIVQNGFRPANPDVELGFPFVEENGVTVAGPATILDVPEADVIAAIQQSWALVKKQADILIVMDTSGSMQTDNKIGQAIDAAIAFLEQMESTNRVGLMLFSENVELRVPLGNFESVENQLYSNIRGLRADGGTELYQALLEAVNLMSDEPDEDRIRAIVLLSDGADTGDSGVTLNQVTAAINATDDSLNPVIVIPVAYGEDADINTLSSIARASQTRVQSGDASNILSLLELIGSYF